MQVTAALLMRSIQPCLQESIHHNPTQKIGFEGDFQTALFGHMKIVSQEERRHIFNMATNICSRSTSTM